MTARKATKATAAPAEAPEVVEEVEVVETIAPAAPAAIEAPAIEAILAATDSAAMVEALAALTLVERQDLRKRAMRAAMASDDDEAFDKVADLFEAAMAASVAAEGRTKRTKAKATIAPEELAQRAAAQAAGAIVAAHAWQAGLAPEVAQLAAPLVAPMVEEALAALAGAALPMTADGGGGAAALAHTPRFLADFRRLTGGGGGGASAGRTLAPFPKGLVVTGPGGGTFTADGEGGLVAQATKANKERGLAGRYESPSAAAVAAAQAAGLKSNNLNGWRVLTVEHEGGRQELRQAHDRLVAQG